LGLIGTEIMQDVTLTTRSNVIFKGIGLRRRA
jgi:hypothetical protein